MALTRQQKEAQVLEVGATLKSATAIVFIAFDGLNVDDVEDLRGKLFAEKSHMQVVPKRLLRLAAKGANLEFDPTTFDGQVALVWGEDAAAPARVLHTFAKEHEAVRLLAGVLEQNVLTLEQVTALAQLPSREQLLSQLVSVLVGPMRSLQTVLTGAQRQLVYVLSATAEKKGKA